MYENHRENRPPPRYLASSSSLSGKMTVCGVLKSGFYRKLTMKKMILITLLVWIASVVLMGCERVSTNDKSRMRSGGARASSLYWGHRMAEAHRARTGN